MAGDDHPRERSAQHWLKHLLLRELVGVSHTSILGSPKKLSHKPNRPLVTFWAFFLSSIPYFGFLVYFHSSFPHRMLCLFGSLYLKV